MPAVHAALALLLGATLFVNLVIFTHRHPLVSFSLGRRLLATGSVALPPCLLTFLVGTFFVLNLRSPWAALLGLGAGLLMLPGALAHGWWLRRFLLAVEQLDQPSGPEQLQRIHSMLEAYIVADDDQSHRERRQLATLAAQRLDELGRPEDAAAVRQLAVE